MRFEAKAGEDRFALLPQITEPLPEEDRRLNNARPKCDAGPMGVASRDACRLANAGHDFHRAMRDDGI